MAISVMNSQMLESILKNFVKFLTPEDIIDLSDVMTIDEGLKETIREQIYESYPELEFDDELVKQELSAVLENNGADSYFICRRELGGLGGRWGVELSYTKF